MGTMTQPKLGIRVARLIIQGDLQQARELAEGHYTWEVAEARAIVGACRVASLRGWLVSWEYFFQAPELV
jgi:hypothetical protein